MTTRSTRTRDDDPHRQGSWESTPSGIGVIAHAVIAELVVVDGLSDDRLTERCLLTAARYASGAARTARSNTVVAAGWANHYLRHLAPRQNGWRTLAAEFDVATGRVDVGYTHTDGYVLYDEIKTGYATRTVLDPAWLEQANRYADAGQRRWSEQFAGVRIVPIGSTNLISLVHPDHAPALLRPTASDPLRRQT